MNSALIVIDMQNDFVKKTGSLNVSGAEEIIPKIKKLIKTASEEKVVIVFTLDWHEENDTEFSRDNWPKHCVKGTEGAEIVKELHLPDIGIGEVKNPEYNKFDIELREILEKNNVKELYFTGVATDYCVKNTASSALKEGFKVFIVRDAVKAVDESNGKKALQELKEKGAKIVSSKKAMNNIKK